MSMYRWGAYTQMVFDQRSEFVKLSTGRVFKIIYWIYPIINNYWYNSYCYIGLKLVLHLLYSKGLKPGEYDNDSTMSTWRCWILQYEFGSVSEI
jgi:hypothetical protein